MNRWWLATWLTDYLLFCGYALGLSWVMHEVPTQFWHGAAFAVTFLLLCLVRDASWSFALPSQHMHPMKRWTWPSSEDLREVLKSLLILPIAFGLMTYYGVADCSPNLLDGFWPAFRVVGINYATNHVLKEVVGMQLLHRWMHKSKLGWKHHKLHHVSRKDLNFLRGAKMEPIDMVAEQFVGLLLSLLLNWWLLGDPTLHLVAFFWAAFGDSNTHSCNVYSAYFMIPPLDYRIPVALSHTLHHAVVNDYYTVANYKHVFSAEARQRDIDRYNRIFDTDIFK